VRAAASSMARGRPSSRTHSSATARALSEVSAKVGRTARARWTNRATEALWVSSSTSVGLGASSPGGTVGCGSGGTGNSHSERSRSGSRDVARMRRPRQASSRTPTSPAAASRCSQLSRTRSMLRSPSARASAWSGDCALSCISPHARPIALTRSAGSWIGARSTKRTPSAKALSTVDAMASARRVLPTPPGPVKVSSRAPSSSSRRRASSTSRARPIKGRAGTGRRVKAASTLTLCAPQ
jgi:hypothetical protein